MFDPWIRKIPLGGKMAAHSSILTWDILWTEKASKACMCS